MENEKQFIEIPISIKFYGDTWIICSNSETDRYLGKHLHSVTSGQSREEAIENFFRIVRFNHDYWRLSALSYQRWVPFRKGPWKKYGGQWFVVFGIHFHFRYGKNMKGGWYIPFTKLNISVINEWLVYKRLKNL